MNPSRLTVLVLTLLGVPCVLFGQGRPPVFQGPPAVVEISADFAFRCFEHDESLSDAPHGFYVVWTHSLNGIFTLVGQDVSASGSARWDLPGTPLVDRLSRADAWDAFPDSQGGLILTWIDPEGLYAQRFGPNGKPVWPGHPAVLLSSGSCASPTGEADAAGGAYLVWSEKRYANRWVLVTQHVNAAGTTLWDRNGIRVSLRPSDQKNPRTVYDGQAGAIVAWKDFRENASQIQSQRIDYQGNRLWGAEGILVSAPAGAADERPLLAPLGDGGAIVSWMAPSAGANRLFMQSIGPKGRFRWNPEGVPVSLGTGESWNPVIYGDGKGTVWAGWEDYRKHSSWQAFTGILHSGASLQRPHVEIPLAPSQSDQGHVALADSGRGGIFASWLDNRSSGSGVYVQEIGSDMQPRMEKGGHLVAGGLNNPSTPQIVSLGPGRAAVLVADRQKKNRWSLSWTTVNGPAPGP